MDTFGFIFPGQGAQYPKMGKDFYDNFLEYREIIQEASDLLKKDFCKIIFQSDVEEIKKTENSQLAIFITSIGSLKVLEKQIPEICNSISAGLSLGEYSALVCSKKISLKDALFLIEKRAFFMKEACTETNGAMAAVLGIDAGAIKEVLKENVWIANYNTLDQTVISGDKDQISLVKEDLKKKGAKVIPLKVAGAFHTPFMMKAEKNFQKVVKEDMFLNSDKDIVMNVTGKIASLKDIFRNLITQITSSIRWFESIQTMEKRIKYFVEIGPSKTLTKMNNKNTSLQTFSLENIFDLEKLSNIIR